MFSQFKEKYPEALFVVKFLLLFSFLYFGTEFWIGITSPGNYYNKFCDDYLNYIRWYRELILNTANCICKLFGYNAYLSNTYNLKLVNGRGVNMVYSCIGYGIQSFWIAFTITFPDANFMKRVKWLLGGCISLFFLNAIRIAVLIIIADKYKQISNFQTHHLIYNIVIYAVVTIFIYFFAKLSTSKKQL